MWNVPTYRIRAYVRGLRKTSRKTPTDNSFPYHYKRTRAEIAIQMTPENVIALNGDPEQRTVIQASVVLNDFSPRGLFLFSSEQVALGQRVYLTIHGPKRFFIRAKIAFCRRLSYHTATFSTEATYPFRIGVLFEFKSIEERIAVKKYYDDLAGKYLRTIEC